jgi:hypothetical protein
MIRIVAAAVAVVIPVVGDCCCALNFLTADATGEVGGDADFSGPPAPFALRTCHEDRIELVVAGRLGLLNPSRANKSASSYFLRQLPLVGVEDEAVDRGGLVAAVASGVDVVLTDKPPRVVAAAAVAKSRYVFRGSVGVVDEDVLDMVQVMPRQPFVLPRRKKAQPRPSILWPLACRRHPREPSCKYYCPSTILKIHFMLCPIRSTSVVENLETVAISDVTSIGHLWFPMIK